MEWDSSSIEVLALLLLLLLLAAEEAAEAEAGAAEAADTSGGRAVAGSGGGGGMSGRLASASAEATGSIRGTPPFLSAAALSCSARACASSFQRRPISALT